MTRTLPSNEAGFTLVEMLVSLVASALLLTTLTWVVATVASQWRQSEAIADAQENWVTTSRTLVQLIEMAQPGQSAGGLEGTAQSFSVLTLAPLATGEDALVQATVSLADSGTLALHLTPLAGNGQLPSALLLDGLETVRLRYARMSAQGLVWVADWSPRDRLPAAVEMTVEPQGGPAPLRLIARPRLTVDPRCGLDPVTLECRM